MDRDAGILFVRSMAVDAVFDKERVGLFVNPPLTFGIFPLALFLWKRLRNQFSLDSQAPELLSWYWHLVDAVWVVIVIVVYVLGH